MDIAQILPDLRRISCDGSLLYDFVEQFPDSCHVREVQTNKYLTANHQMVSNCGLQSIHDVIGQTQHEVWFDISTQKDLSQTVISNRKEDLQLVNKIENQILLAERPVNAKHFILNKKGNVRFEHIVKTGVWNHEHKIIALLSIFLDLTHQIPLPRLFKLYQAFYSKKEAIQKFLSHFDLESDFDPLTPPTCAEIQVLIAMRNDPKARAKVVAKQLGYSVATVRNHISHLQDKLKMCALYDVLYKLPVVRENEQSAYACI